MRILFITQTYAPEPLRIISEFAESLKATGHDIVVLTGLPNYPEGKIYPGYRIKLCQKETINGIPVIRLPIYPNHGNSAFKRLLNYISFAASVAIISPWYIPSIDVIHVYDPPFIAPSIWFLSRFFRVPYTLDIQDMWPETLHGTTMMKSRLVVTVIDKLAKWMYRHSKGIRVISNGFRDNLISKGVPNQHIYTVPNWVDTDLYRPLAPNADLALRSGLAGKFNVIYAGNMGKAQNLEVVLDAAPHLDDLTDIQFVLLGYGTDLDRLREIARQRNIKNVLFLDRLPEEEIPPMLALAEVLLVQLRDEPVFRITIPHKPIRTWQAESRF